MQGPGGVTLRAAEQQVLGANHEQFGAALCKLWKFPASFAFVTGYHHRPLELAENSRVLTSLVHVADVTCANLKIGFSKSVECNTVSAEILTQLNLTQEQVDAVGKAIPDAMQEAAALLQDAGV